MSPPVPEGPSFGGIAGARVPGVVFLMARPYGQAGSSSFLILSRIKEWVSASYPGFARAMSLAWRRRLRATLSLSTTLGDH